MWLDSIFTDDNTIINNVLGYELWKLWEENEKNKEKKTKQICMIIKDGWSLCVWLCIYLSPATTYYRTIRADILHAFG